VTSPSHPSVAIAHSAAPPSAQPLAHHPQASGSIVSAIIETTKPRIVRLVCITSGVGFGINALGRSWATTDFLIAAIGSLAGTALAAAGANTLNQWAERDRDALMPRTCARPLPQRRLEPSTALAAGLVLSVLGFGLLLPTSGLAAAFVALVTILTYVLIYTPLKPLTPAATVVGAIPGALPPLIGWCAGSGDSGLAPLASLGGWSLFLLMFVWQIPHFLAIAWLYKDDYAKGGYAVMPVTDPLGHRTSATILIWAVLFIPIALVPALFIRLQPGPGLFYSITSVLTGLIFLGFCVKLAWERTRPAARATFIASVIHLPILMAAMLLDTVVRAFI
jgi:heme o synthase